ncbi:unnamed protein product [Amaranthus hypochondriacus]
MQILHINCVATRTTSSHFKKLQVTNNKAELLINNPKSYQVLSKNGVGNYAELHIQQVIEKQSKGMIPKENTQFDPFILRKAYETCRQICAERSTTYYLGSLLLPEQRKKAIWAVYAWGQLTDELVDGASTNTGSSAMLEQWEERLDDIFNGRPHDIADIALADTVQRFSLTIEPFKDLMKGMRIDTSKTQYENYQELELYCYYVAVTGCLMAVPILGISLDTHPSSAQSIYEAAFSLGVANQLTNILRDVAEDASRGRVYLPQDELREFGLTNEDIFSRNVSEKWCKFTKMQVERARSYYVQGEHITSQLYPASRWPVWTSMMLYKKILDKIEENNYDNLTKRARVGNIEKLVTLPLAYAKAMGWCPKKN